MSRLVPSVTVGEYRAGAERPEDGGLYPLAEAGTYGQVPRAKHPGKWAQPKAYVPRWAGYWLGCAVARTVCTLLLQGEEAEDVR